MRILLFKFRKEFEMTKISIKKTKNKTIASGNAKKSFVVSSCGDELIRKRVKRAVKNVAVPSHLESKVMDLLWKHL